MKVRFSQLFFSGAVVMTLSVVGLISQPAFAQSDSESGQTFSMESHNNCGSHGTDENVDAPGKWAFHCHLLYHMEVGMFRTVAVVDRPKEVS